MIKVNLDKSYKIYKIRIAEVIVRMVSQNYYCKTVNKNDVEDLDLEIVKEKCWKKIRKKMLEIIAEVTIIESSVHGTL